MSSSLVATEQTQEDVVSLVCIGFTGLHWLLVCIGCWFALAAGLLIIAFDCFGWLVFAAGLLLTALVGFFCYISIRLHWLSNRRLFVHKLIGCYLTQMWLKYAG